MALKVRAFTRGLNRLSWLKSFLHISPTTEASSDNALPPRGHTQLLTQNLISGPPAMDEKPVSERCHHGDYGTKRSF